MSTMKVILAATATDEKATELTKVKLKHAKIITLIDRVKVLAGSVNAIMVINPSTPGKATLYRFYNRNISNPKVTDYVVSQGPDNLFYLDSPVVR